MKSWVKIVATEINIAQREEGFTSGILPLPDHVKHVAAYTLREVNRETIGVSIQDNICGQREGFEVRPLERLGGIVGICRNEDGEGARRVGNCRGKASVVAPSLNLGGRPVHTRKIEAGVLCATGTGKLAIGNQLTVVALGHKKADFMPVVESLRPSDSNRCLAGITHR